MEEPRQGDVALIGGGAMFLYSYFFTEKWGMEMTLVELLASSFVVAASLRLLMFIVIMATKVVIRLRSKKDLVGRQGMELVLVLLAFAASMTIELYVFRNGIFTVVGITGLLIGTSMFLDPTRELVEKDEQIESES